MRWTIFHSRYIPETRVGGTITETLSKGVDISLELDGLGQNSLPGLANSLVESLNIPKDSSEHIGKVAG